jgi:signal peptidase I
MKTKLLTLLAAAIIPGSVWAYGATMAPLSIDRAGSDAMAVAARSGEATVMRAVGDSMLPFFGNGAVLVVRPLGVERVRTGMIVVYRNNDGERVAHRVTGETAEGWVVRGYNNDRDDSTRVAAANLEGLVYATFYSNGRWTSPEIMAAVAGGVPVALAAPAK